MFDRMVNQFFEPATPSGVRRVNERMPYLERVMKYGPQIAILRLEGKTFAEIARALGYSKTMVNNTLNDWIYEVKNETL